MTPQVSDFILVLLEDTDKYIAVADGLYVTEKQKGQVQIKICDDNGKYFIAALHNVLLAPDLHHRLFFDYYVNEFRKYLFITQRFLRGVLYW